MENDLYFHTNKIVDVHFEFNNQKLYGKIFFTQDSSAYLEIITNDINISFQKECPDSLSCYSDKHKFILISCKKFGLQIHPRLFILDLPDEVNTFENFEMNINELNVILHNGYFTNKLAGDEFVSQINKSNFKADILYSDEIKKISDFWTYSYAISHNTEIITKFSQRHIISVDTKKPLPLESIIQESMHIRLIFSLLTLMKVNINYLWLLHNGKKYSVYYPVSPKNSDLKIEWTNSLISLKDINQEQWVTIFNNSYKREFSNKLWIRFDGMLSYNSYWEYEFLAYMSILDFYLSSKLGKSNGTFKQKYLRKNAELSEYIINYIALPEEKFKRLLAIRNGVAHCNPDDLEIIDDISILMILKRRLVVFLDYLALKDLGVSDEIYAESAYISHNSILMNACTNKKWLKKITGNVLEIIVDKTDYEYLIKNRPGINEIIFTQKDDKSHEINKKGTLQLKEDWRNIIQENMNICDYIDINISTDKKSFTTTYIPQIHIHTYGEKDFIEMNGVYILSRKKLK